jgi:hypothetical protein
VQCPQCKNEVPVTEAHYGALYTCPKCMAVYFINFEGQPEYGEMTEPPEEFPMVETPSVESAPGAEPVFENNFEAPIENNFDISLDNNFVMAPELEIAPEVNSFNAAAQDIANYANDNEEVSNINYDVFIRGLDTKEVFTKFKEAIDDAKFGWILEDILAEIKNGEVHFKKLNAIQAYVLASRIQFLNLEIEWKQNVAF